MTYSLAASSKYPYLMVVSCFCAVYGVRVRARFLFGVMVLSGLVDVDLESTSIPRMSNIQTDPGGGGKSGLSAGCSYI
ncbi:MAG: hypothetical protein BWY82_02048 [Verrucomicrobia bacterium ADurb.Bin474]|nr:MAG: hypothetical protein BWY82_02048 [Verrucomicrobia bacterium ADurb.Bin474]